MTQDPESADGGLSSDEMREFARLGYIGPFDLPAAVSEKFTNPAFLRNVVKVLGGGSLNPEKIRNQHLYSSSLVELVTAPAILDRVRTMLGDDILLWVAHIMARRPGTGGQKWHSDAINQYLRGIHASVALTDMTMSNGCLSVIAGSHLYRTSLWAREDAMQFDRNDVGAVAQLADTAAPWNAPHHVRHMELRAGQFFFTWGGLWHGVGPNRTNSTRMACVARYVRPDFRCRDYGFRDDCITVGDPLPCLLVHGRDTFRLNDIRPRPRGDIFT